MENCMKQALRQSLEELRAGEERYRDAALAIQRVLEAEGEMYPAAEAIAPVVRTWPLHAHEPSSPAGTAGGTFLAKPTEKKVPRTWPKTCERCGRPYDAKAPNNKFCGPECYFDNEEERKKVRSLAKKSAAKPTIKKQAKPMFKAKKVCAVCGQEFTAWRKDQRCCSTVCGKRRHQTGQPASKTKTVNLDKPSPHGEPTRIDRIKMLTGYVDPIPERVRDAAAEARESDNMN
jgi:hypothetical protein